jgi:hypothetical protein
MVEVRCGKWKIARPANGGRFAFRGIVHSIKVEHEEAMAGGAPGGR